MESAVLCLKGQCCDYRQGLQSRAYRDSVAILCIECSCMIKRTVLLLQTRNAVVRLKGQCLYYIQGM